MGKDNVFKKINWKKVLEYSLPAIATLAIILLVMIIKGIAPFGNGEIAYIDYNAGLVPAYTALWDLLHGKGNMFISYDLGAGAPLYASNVINKNIVDTFDLIDCKEFLRMADLVRDKLPDVWTKLLKL